jgi:hypothetical protein
LTSFSEYLHHLLVWEPSGAVVVVVDLLPSVRPPEAEVAAPFPPLFVPSSLFFFVRFEASMMFSVVG